MSTLLQKYLNRQNRYSDTWGRGSKCMVLIAQVVAAFGMNPYVRWSPSVETFYVSKTSTLSEEQLADNKWSWILRSYLWHFGCERHSGTGIGIRCHFILQFNHSIICACWWRLANTTCIYPDSRISIALGLYSIQNCGYSTKPGH